jgi:uncharacterized coiled-coil protein SlyX
MNPNLSQSPASASKLSVAELVERNPAAVERPSRLEWWYQLAAPVAEPSASSTLKQRESYRRGRLIATILLMQIVVICSIAAPVGLFVNPLLLPNLFITLAILFIAVFANHRGRVIIAGILAMGVLELSLGLNVVFTSMNGLTVFALPLFDLLVLGELLAVSLLPEGVVFLTAFVNVLFIGAMFLLLPKTPEFAAVLQSPSAVDALARPIVIQIMVAVVTFLWVRSARRALERADRATTIAALEHSLAEQGKLIAQQKEQLERGIQQIIDTQTRIARGDLSARVPLTQENVLWGVAGMLNNVLARLQRASQAEEDVRRTRQAAVYLMEVLRQSNGRTINWPYTGTVFDALVAQYNAALVLRASSGKMAAIKS